ncbi:Imm65 family immunity protein [Bacteroides ovatus]|nr:Imm65 family immunity protein [Bacteroides ovatus]
MVVSKLGEKKILIDTSLLRGWGTYFNITELWPYFSGYVKGCPVQMGVMSHDVELSDSYLSCNVDSIKRNLLWNENQNTTMIKNVYGQMYLKNNTDSVVYLSSSTKKHYAVVDGQDSLYLSLSDSLPIILGPNEKKY